MAKIELRPGDLIIGEEVYDNTVDKIRMMLDGYSRKSTKSDFFITNVYLYAQNYKDIHELCKEAHNAIKAAASESNMIEWVSMRQHPIVFKNGYQSKITIEFEKS